MHGIQLSYTRVGGGRVVASRAALLAGLRALGAPVEGLADVPDAGRQRAQELARRVVEPVTLAWDGRLPDTVEVRLPKRLAEATKALALELEEGEVVRWGWDARVLRGEEIEGLPHVLLAVRFGGEVPFGYHTLRLEVAGHAHTSMVVSAPRQAVEMVGRSWGVFLPLYALRTSRSWGPGDVTDLGSLTEWANGLGGSVVATLPLLSAFLDEREGLFEPSPYAPASRMFWNELYLDPTAAPELVRSPEALSIVESPSFRKGLRELRTAPLIDYRRAAQAKRHVLEALARTFFAEPGDRGREFDRFLRSNHRAVDYARFRAACRRHGVAWSAWPAAERRGRLPREGGERDAYRYHLYVQWLAAQQMERAAGTAREGGTGLYFDFPLGVHPHGYDVWRDRGAFVAGGSAGAPPDAFFASGQNWEFPPLHPDGIRERRYRYFIDCVRHVFRNAGVVRIDHVMGLHRIYLVPTSMDTRHGVYVRYRPDEFYAILTLESWRGGATVVGEDLGTVAPVVRHAMARHGLSRSYVLYFATRTSRNRGLSGPPARSVASVNTHDLPPFAGFWRGLDIRERLDHGLIGKNEAATERDQRVRIRRTIVGPLQRKGWLTRGEDERSVLRAVLAYLASSEARMMLVNLEDLWLERRPQNVPGTTTEHPNWRRPARYSFEEFRERRDVLGTLALVSRLRGEIEAG
jgi:4-alpha-glucanotransferase